MAIRSRGDGGPVSASPPSQHELVYDVAVVGAGVVGTAVARLLSRHRLDVVVIEAASDVGAGTSKANTAILHTGFDATPGTIESRLVARGYELLGRYAAEVGIAIEPTGAVLVAWDDEQLSTLPMLATKAEANGYHACETLTTSELREREPNLGAGALGALVVPGESIIDPWSPPIAFASEAVLNGVTLMRDARVTAIATHADHHELTIRNEAPDESIVLARWIVNAAGLRGDEVHRLLGHDSFTVRPRRGELIVFDKMARSLVSHIVLPVPTGKTKGVLVAPTVFGNVLLGPTADDIDDKSATGSTRDGIDSLLDKGARIMPSLVREEVTAVYAGLRAATSSSDYCIELDAEQRYVCLGGIRSTGLTAAMALAEEALGLLRSGGLALADRPADELVAVRLTSLGEASHRPWQDGGRIVCHCERVTAGEIALACRGPVPAIDLDGVRRRTRALMGRCQGFHCTAAVAALTAIGTGRTMSSLLHLPEPIGPEGGAKAAGGQAR